MGRAAGAIGYVVVALVFGPLALVLYQIALRLIRRPPRGKHRRQPRWQREPHHPTEKGSTMTTQQPEPRHDDGGPETVHNGPATDTGDIIEADEVDVVHNEDGNAADNDDDAGHAEDGSDTQEEDVESGRRRE